MGDLFLPIPSTAVMSSLGLLYGPVWGGLIGGIGSVGSGVIDNIEKEFFEEVLNEFFTSLMSFVGLVPETALAATDKQVPYDVHCLTHLPADPNCEICQQAKMTRKPLICVYKKIQ